MLSLSSKHFVALLASKERTLFHCAVSLFFYIHICIYSRYGVLVIIQHSSFYPLWRSCVWAWRSSCLPRAVLSLLIVSPFIYWKRFHSPSYARVLHRSCCRHKKETNESLRFSKQLTAVRACCWRFYKCVSVCVCACGIQVFVLAHISSDWQASALVEWWMPLEKTHLILFKESREWGDTESLLLVFCCNSVPFQASFSLKWINKLK